MEDEGAKRRAAPPSARQSAEEGRTPAAPDAAAARGGCEPLERTRVSARRIVAELVVIAVFALGVWQIAVLLLAFAGR